MEVNVLVWGKGEGGSVDERPAANSVWCRSARAAHVGSRHICGAQLRATFARKHSGRRSIVDRFSERRRGMARRTRLSWRSRGNPKGRYCRKRFWRAHTSRHGRYANAVEGRSVGRGAVPNSAQRRNFYRVGGDGSAAECFIAGHLPARYGAAVLVYRPVYLRSSLERPARNPLLRVLPGIVHFL